MTSGEVRDGIKETASETCERQEQTRKKKTTKEKEESCDSEELTLRLLMSYIYIYMERIFLMFLDHTRRRSTVDRTPLDE